ncbi:MAG: leucine-rich repeat domain-containing protein [Treponema sp.]|nr:leucine-rich repeat domain-containing protein [Treponema sp.]
MKKIMYILLGVIMLTLTPSIVKAETTNTSTQMTTTIAGTEFTYQFHGNSTDKVDIVKVSNAGEKLVFPAKLDGYSVYRIGGNTDDTSLQWDESSKKVKKVIIKKGIKEIGFSAFETHRLQDVSNIESVFIPKSVKKISSCAFAFNKKMKVITIRNSNVKIGTDAFVGCKKLKKINWPKDEFTGEIGISAFSHCDLRSLYIPYMKSKKQIGRFAFSGNKKLKKITFSNEYTNVSVGKDWFTDCPKSQIVVGKNAKTFSSKVNGNAGSVRLLGAQTKLKGFKKPMDVPYYYIQYKKFIVPKGSKAFKVLKNAKYGKVNDSGEERYSADGNNYFGSVMKKVKIVIR